LGDSSNEEIEKIANNMESIKFKGQFTDIEDTIDPAKLLPSNLILL
jgi:hypothetical protein